MTNFKADISNFSPSSEPMEELRIVCVYMQKKEATLMA